MASDATIKKMRDDATCSICQRIMVEPMIIDCGHSFCKLCISSYFENRPLSCLLKIGICPLCQARFSRIGVRPNRPLQNLIETLKQMDHKNKCEQHGEQLCLFCEDDGQLICWRCERTPQHRGHTTLLVTAACQVYKGKLQETVAALRNQEEKCQSQMALVNQHANLCVEITKNQKQKISYDFKSLQNFLSMEEKSYLWRLEKEREDVLQKLHASEASLEEQSQKLQNHILRLEKKLQDLSTNLLQGVKDTLNRSSTVELNLPAMVSFNLNTKCQVSELYFDVKTILKSYQVNITLDPETAHPELTLSENCRRVKRWFGQEKPSTSKRFSALCCVLGRETFTAGRSYFEVEMRRTTRCDVGVCVEHVPRDVDMNLEPSSGFWSIRLLKNQACAALTSPIKLLPIKTKPKILGVFLDYEAGFVSFYNMSMGSHIFTFPKASFSDTLRPFFRLHAYSSLFLPPLTN